MLTAMIVWQVYREIETAMKLLSDMQYIREREADLCYRTSLGKPPGQGITTDYTKGDIH